MGHLLVRSNSIHNEIIPVALASAVLAPEVGPKLEQAEIEVQPNPTIEYPVAADF